MRPSVLALLLAACAVDDPAPADTDLLADAYPGVQVLFDPVAAAAGGEAFFDAPYPSDLRRTPDGAPPLLDLPGLGRAPLIDAIAATTTDLRGYSVLPVGWFRLEGPTAPRDADQVIPADPSSPVLLVDVDPDSPERGRLIPTVAATLPPDRWVPDDLLAVAPVPGFLLRPATTYAFAVRRDLGDADGAPLGVSREVLAALRGAPSDAPWAAEVADALAPLRAVLPDLGLVPDDLAAATVFTTGDVVADTFRISEAVRAAHAPQVEDLGMPERGADHPSFCELHGTLTVPEHQRGTPPWDEDGLFVPDGDGLEVQGHTTIPVVVTVPRAPMPPEGYPLGLYFHGSGGTADQLVTRGPRPPGGEEQLGYGPAHVLALQGIAGAGSAHPVNPERVPGASGIAYLNFNNLAAFRDTFRQGILEQRLYLDALLDLRVPPEALVGCEGPVLPAGADAFRFDPDAVVAVGQSMGGMYTNMIGAVEPRIRAVVPTGAGGHWTRFILVTSLLGEGRGELLLRALVGTDQPLTFLHPALAMAQHAWEPAEPLVYTPRLARRPLPGHPVRPIYEPVGLDDSYFPPPVFDAMALAYGNGQAGEEVWPEMQAMLALDDRAGLAPYPVADNRTSEDGTPYTGVVVQYEGDGFSDPHTIYAQLEEVKHQYGCFLRTFLETGVAVVPEGVDLDAPCPGP